VEIDKTVAKDLVEIDKIRVKNLVEIDKGVEKTR
jgi:hypothetical protein